MLTVADQQGQHGLDYITSGDPRTPTQSLHRAFETTLFQVPTAYAGDGSGQLVLASGVEARLIEAEAVLRAGDATTWLAKLNALRTDSTFDTQPTADPADDPAAVDTLWHAGTGGVPGLRPLADPGIDTAQVSLLFRERAFWLFLTGHRQGDLRRLIRQYGRSQVDVYPAGQYSIVGGAVNSSYGTDVTLPIPEEERVRNPQFTGCASRGS